jgi:ABC-type branched-subunit amino acid transport system ATPase component
MRSWPAWPGDGARGAAAVPVAERVEENLLIGTYGRKVDGYWNLETIYELFPILRSGATTRARRCRAGSSRWSRSAAR